MKHQLGEAGATADSPLVDNFAVDNHLRWNSPSVRSKFYQTKFHQASLSEWKFKSSPADRSWPKSGRPAGQSTTTEVTRG